MKYSRLPADRHLEVNIISEKFTDEQLTTYEDRPLAPQTEAVLTDTVQAEWIRQYASGLAASTNGRE